MKKESMTFRLKLEIDGLVNEMVGKLPESLFISDSTAFLDPSMGGGQFVQAIESRLRKHGHSDNNIKNRVFGVEKSLLRVNYAVNSRKLMGSYTVDNKDVPDIFMNMKFDAIVGNPPFQVLNEDGKNWGGGRKLWEEFVFRSIENLKDGGYLCYIHPVTWRAYSEKAILKHVHQKFNPIYINLETAKKYFTGVGSRFDWYVLQKSKYSGNTVVESTAGKTSINIQQWNVIPNGFSSVSKSIFEKMFSYEDKLDLKKNQSHHSDRDHVSKEKNKEYIYPIKHSIRNGHDDDVLWASRPHECQTKKKIIVSRGGYLIPVYDSGEYGVSQDALFMEVSNKKEGEYLIRWFTSKLFKFLIQSTKFSAFHNHKLLNLFPYPKNLSEKFTDADLYVHFKLTNEEIKFIEESVKD